MRSGRQVWLRAGGLMRFGGDTAACLYVHEGTVWITEAGRQQDVFLRPGMRWRFREGSLTLVESLGRAHLTVEDTGVPAPARPLRLADRIAGALFRRLAR